VGGRGLGRVDSAITRPTAVGATKVVLAWSSRIEVVWSESGFGLSPGDGAFALPQPVVTAAVGRHPGSGRACLLRGKRGA